MAGGRPPGSPVESRVPLTGAFPPWPLAANVTRQGTAARELCDRCFLTGVMTKLVNRVSKKGQVPGI